MTAADRARALLDAHTAGTLDPDTLLAAVDDADADAILPALMHALVELVSAGLVDTLGEAGALDYLTARLDAARRGALREYAAANGIEL
jgi:hypothetical protein